MESIVVIGGIVLFVLFGPWVLVWRVNVRRKRELEEDQRLRRDLTSRISALEQSVQRLEAQRPAPMPQEATPQTYERPVVVPRAPIPSSPTVPAPAPPPLVVEPPASVRIAESCDHVPGITGQPSSLPASPTFLSAMLSGRKLLSPVWLA